MMMIRLKFIPIETAYGLIPFSKGRLDTGIKIDDQTIIGVITAVAGEVNVTIENRLSANYEPLNCRFQGQFNKNITRSSIVYIS